MVDTGIRIGKRRESLRRTRLEGGDAEEGGDARETQSICCVASLVRLVHPRVRAVPREGITGVLGRSVRACAEAEARNALEV